MQRWGSGQAPSGSALLRTGALMSLASFGTAGLVVCGALGVDVPDGGSFLGAFGTGPSAVVVDAAEGWATPAVPSGPASAQAAAPGDPRPAGGRAGTTPPAGLPSPGDPLSGTDSWAASTPTDLDSVVHPAREQVAPAPVPTAPALRRPLSAVRSAAGGAAALPEAPAPPGPTTSSARAVDGEPQAAAAPPAPAAAPSNRPVMGTAGDRPTAPARRAHPAARPPRPPKAPKAPKAAKAPVPAAAPKAPKAPAVPQTPRIAQAAAVPAPADAPPTVQAVKPAKPAKPSPPVTSEAARTAQPSQPAPRPPEQAPQTSPGEGAGGAPPHAGRADHAGHPKGEPPGQDKGRGAKH